MTELTVWAQFLPNPDNLGRFVVNVLAVAGGALVGGLVSGLLVQLGARLLYGGTVPKAILNAVRVVGAVVLAWVVALFVFSGAGGGGPGGGGGLFPGGGGNGTEPASTGREGPTARDTRREEVGPPTTPENTLRVEVLGEGVSGGRFYRVAGETQAETFEEIKRTVERKRQEASGLQKLEIVLYENSPDRDTPVVKDLETWAKMKGLNPRTGPAPGKAP
jgi:hypothetical protein